MHARCNTVELGDHASVPYGAASKKALLGLDITLPTYADAITLLQNSITEAESLPVRCKKFRLLMLRSLQFLPEMLRWAVRQLSPRVRV
jgi:hypothetical protein